MPKWLHRTTKQVLVSVPSADLPGVQANYIEEPDLSSVTGVPNRYWIITGDVITEMDAAAKAAVDAAALTTQRDSAVTELDGNENTLRQIVKIIMVELNILRAQHGLPARTMAQLRNAIRNGYGS